MNLAGVLAPRRVRGGHPRRVFRGAPREFRGDESAEPVDGGSQSGVEVGEVADGGDAHAFGGGGGCGVVVVAATGGASEARAERFEGGVAGREVVRLVLGGEGAVDELVELRGDARGHRLAVRREG